MIRTSTSKTNIQASSSPQFRSAAVRTYHLSNNFVKACPTLISVKDSRDGNPVGLGRVIYIMILYYSSIVLFFFSWV